MSDDKVDLASERERIDAVWRNMSQTHVSLPLAAALAFHQVRGGQPALVNRQDYDDALNLAAAALSRLVTVYVTEDSGQGRVPIAVDLGTHSFNRGATELRAKDGSTRRDLSLQRGELLSAISLIKRVGLARGIASAA